MKILAIDTSCDDTAVSVLSAEQAEQNVLTKIKILSHQINSQIDLHQKFGGVFPTMAKREHQKNICLVAASAIKNAQLTNTPLTISEEQKKQIAQILNHEPELLEYIFTFLTQIGKVEIDAIAITNGPGLEPTLWVGINFAKVLSLVWQVPIIAINHLEGHILSALIQHQDEQNIVLKNFTFPAIALLVSGGHTQIILVKNFGQYEIVGETLDDAVGEAFDKVARLLGLNYPGGPEISRLAAIAETENLQITSSDKLPRPMLNSHDLNFSFSGLKTAVRYKIEKTLQTKVGNSAITQKTSGEKLDEQQKKLIALDFENACVEVLIKKCQQAAEHFAVQDILVGGGVIANQKLRRALTVEMPEKNILIPDLKYSNDNATMIGLAGLFQLLKPDFRKTENKEIIANGNLKI